VRGRGCAAMLWRVAARNVRLLLLKCNTSTIATRKYQSDCEDFLNGGILVHSSSSFATSILLSDEA